MVLPSILDRVPGSSCFPIIHSDYPAAVIDHPLISSLIGVFTVIFTYNLHKVGRFEEFFKLLLPFICPAEKSPSTTFDSSDGLSDVADMQSYSIA